MDPPGEDIRIYFDAAVYLDWADGKRAPEYAELKSLLQRGGARLVFSLGHKVDFRRGTSPESVQRLDRLLDELPSKVLAMSTELVSDERRAVEARLSSGELNGRSQEPPLDLRFESFDAAAKSEELAVAVAVMASAAEPISRARNLGRQPPTPKSGCEAPFVAGFVDIYKRMEECFPELAAVPGLVEAIRSAVERRGGDPATLAQALLSGRGEVGDSSWASTVGGASRWSSAVREVAPGLSLEFELRRNHAFDSSRPSKASDLADRDHVLVLPYVDVATVDADNRSRLQSALRCVKCPRKVALFTNKLNDVRAALSEIRRLLDSGAAYQRA